METFIFKNNNKIYPWRPKTKKVTSVWCLAPCMVVALGISFLVGKLGHSAVTEDCGALSRIQYTVFLVSTFS